MFSGIVEVRGVIKSREKKVNLLTLSIEPEKNLRGIRIGDSIAIDGVCLTVTAMRKGQWQFDVMLETIEKTTFKFLKSGDRINLERSLKVGDRISGHFVSGHIDGVGTIIEKVTRENYVEYQIEIPKNLAVYLACKGSICVDGISLTIGEVKGNCFAVYIIPHTLEMTTLGMKKKNDQVNIETDILAKYLLAQRKK